MRLSRVPVVMVVLALSLAAPASSSFAQSPPPVASGGIVESKTSSGYQVWFPVDQLGGGGIGPQGDIMKGGPHASRMMLMRPRLQFVPEMLKSVEAL
jgi:hypothetical protein